MYQKHITTHRNGFIHGWTDILSCYDKNEPTYMGLAVLKMKAGETFTYDFQNETAWLLMNGKGFVVINQQKVNFQRNSLFDEQPTCFHGSKGEKLILTADSNLEFTIYQSRNQKTFTTQIYLPEGSKDERRGDGLLEGTMLRYVRTLFDGNTSDKNCELVLGEVVTMPGRWSSYPPHSHPQPEIYHYRTTDPKRGFGMGQEGEQAFIIKNNDTLRITDNHPHCQTSAPGFALYYAWAIHHLEGCRYESPQYPEWWKSYEKLRNGIDKGWQPKN